MRFYTKEGCEDWLRGRQRPKPEVVPESQVERINYPPEPYPIFYMAHSIANSSTYRMPTLLWIAEWNLWPSRENWTIDYKLRQGYQDLWLLHEAPGRLFLGHESEDLASFLQIAMWNGWGGYILTQADYANVFFSHDECIEFFARPDGNLAEVRHELGTSKPEHSRVPN